MKQRLQHWLAALVFVSTVGGVATAVMTPAPAMAASGCNTGFLTFPAWYDGLVDGSCNIESPANKGLSLFIRTVALNIVEMILQLVGYISVGFIIYGGYKYMISAGASDGIAKAKKTITNAIVGLLLSIFAVAIVNLISGAI
jgi:hypothetical protein